MKENGYNQWTNATKGAAPAGGTINSSAAPRSGTPATTAPKSNYETPEERAKKQVYIVRQSSISSAISALAIGSKAKLDIKEVIDYAKQIEEFVFGNSNNQDVDTLSTDGFKDLDTMDDVPF